MAGIVSLQANLIESPVATAAFPPSARQHWAKNRTVLAGTIIDCAEEMHRRTTLPEKG